MTAEGTQTRGKRRIGPVHAALATAVLGLAVMPIAFAGAKSPAAHSSGSPKAQVRSLKQRLTALEGRTAALENKPAPATPPIPTTLPPSGPAGGVLTGNYPDPSGLANNSVAGANIVDHTIGNNDLGAGIVGGANLKSTYERVSPGTAVQANVFGNATAQCNPGDKVLGGGYAWQNDSTGSSTQGSTPNVATGGFDDPDQWVVAAKSAINNTLFAWAVCLRA
jgi:hypothetical protein